MSAGQRPSQMLAADASMSRSNLVLQLYSRAFLVILIITRGWKIRRKHERNTTHLVIGWRAALKTKKVANWNPSLSAQRLYGTSFVEQILPLDAPCCRSKDMLCCEKKTFVYGRFERVFAKRKPTWIFFLNVFWNGAKGYSSLKMKKNKPSGSVTFFFRKKDIFVLSLAAIPHCQQQFIPSVP